MSDHEHEIHARQVHVGPGLGYYLPDALARMEKRLSDALARIDALEHELHRHDHWANGSYRPPISKLPSRKPDPGDIDCGLLDEDGGS